MEYITQSIISKAKALKDRYESEILGLQQEAKNLHQKFRDEWITQKEYDLKMEENRHAKDHALQDIKLQAKALKEEYAETVRRITTVKGDKLTADYQLLTGNFTLTKNDLVEMINRNKYNYTMINAIFNYIDRNGITDIPKQIYNPFERTKETYGQFIDIVSDYVTTPDPTKSRSHAYMQKGLFEESLANSEQVFKDFNMFMLTNLDAGDNQNE